MKNKKGFTLVELLVVITVLGIVAGFSWPAITRLREGNKTTKYKSYGDAMIAAAKLYVDSYEEDLFLYEDDLTEEQREIGQCKYIMLYELMEHALIKDFNDNNMSCNSDSSFVRVIRKKGNYEYTYFLGCGKAHEDQSKLSDSEIAYTYPKKNTINHATASSCFAEQTGTSMPVINSWHIESKNQYFNARNVIIQLNATDEDNSIQELSVCIKYNGECGDADFLPYGDQATYEKEFTFPDFLTYNGDIVHVTAKVKDPSGNIISENIPYTLYKECTDKHESGRNLVSECTDVCAGGTEVWEYLYSDSHTNRQCTSVQKTESCYDTECCSIVTYNEQVLQESACSRTCGGGTKNVKIKQIETSKKYNVVCTENIVTVQKKCNPNPCAPFLISVEGAGEIVSSSVNENNQEYCDSDIEYWIRTTGPEGARFTIEVNYDFDQVQGHFEGLLYDHNHNISPEKPEGEYKLLCNGPLDECDFTGIVAGDEVIFFLDEKTNSPSPQLILHIMKDF